MTTLVLTPANPGTLTFPGISRGDLLIYDGSNWVAHVPYFDVKAYGAKGDGTTDDTAAIQAAIDAAETAGGGIVFFPDGDYLLTATLTVEAEAILLMGAGRVPSRLRPNHTAGPVVRFTRSYCGVRLMAVYGAGGRLTASGGSNYGLLFEADDAPDSGTNRTRYITVQDCRIFDQPSHGIAIVGSVTNGSVIERNYIQSNGGHGIVIDRGDLTSRTNQLGSGPASISIRDCEIHGNGGHAIAAGSPTDTAATPSLRIILENLDIATNATDATVRYGTHEVWLRGTNFLVRGCGINGGGSRIGIFAAGRNFHIDNNRFIDCTNSIQVGNFSALPTQGVHIDGLSVFTLAQDPAVVIDSGVASVVSIKNWLPSAITSLVTAGSPVEIDKAPQIVKKASDTSKSSDTTLAADPELKFWLAANEEVAFQVVLQYAGPAAGDIQVAMVVPTGAAIRYGVPGSIKIDAADALVVQNDAAASGTAMTFGASTFRRNIVIEGSVNNGATAGYLEVHWAQATSDATSTTVYAITSVLRAWRKP